MKILCEMKSMFISHFVYVCIEYSYITILVYIVSSLLESTNIEEE